MMKPWLALVTAGLAGEDLHEGYSEGAKLVADCPEWTVAYDNLLKAMQQALSEMGEDAENV